MRTPIEAGCARSAAPAAAPVGVAFIGMGKMGQANLDYAMRQPGAHIVSICDCYRPNMDEALAFARSNGRTPKCVTDFREVLADRAVDAVCISTPDHWHAYMTVEACKAGKDVYVEKPLCVAVEEGKVMIAAARKYNRVVQAGTMQRSAVQFQKAAELVSGGVLGEVTQIRTYNWDNYAPEGIGNPPDTSPPPGLDWDMWLGPAPMRTFNQNRFGVDPKRFSSFRWFWEYAGGMMTDWGIHWLDIVQMALEEKMPEVITAGGGKFWFTDNRETPDTLQVSYQYPQGLIAMYENRSNTGRSGFDRASGIYFHGDKATLFVDRHVLRLIPEKGSPVAKLEMKASNDCNDAHWSNFLECIRSRQRPISDVEKGVRSTWTSLLGNVAYRSGTRIDWDDRTGSVAQKEARRWLAREYRKPWKLEL
jgi:predicted dehydrogenase